MSEEKQGEIVGTIAGSGENSSLAGAPKFQKNRRAKRPESGDKKSSRGPRVKPEFDQKILDIRRVTRVSSGGRRFSFSVSLVVGNHKGMVGVATGKAGDTSLAIDKAYRAAKKASISVNLTKDMSIAHEVRVKFQSATVSIQPAKGKGLIAGSATRDVLELCGIKDVNAKINSPSKNKLNIARATVEALKTLKKRNEKSLDVENKTEAKEEKIVA